MKSKANVVRNSDGSSKQPANLRDQKFFAYLREHAQAPLLLLLRSIDRRASMKIADFIVGYLQGSQADKGFASRRQRAQKLKRALPRAIKGLRKAATSYRELGRIEIPDAGSILDARAPVWLQGIPSLAAAMDAEAARFSALLNDAKKLYNEKRFGVRANYLWLVLLQEFVAAWTLKELGETKQLSSNDIADLITAGKVALGWPEANTETDPELVRKAIHTFRSNPANKWISTCGARAQAEVSCQGLKREPFLLGIEI